MRERRIATTFPGEEPVFHAPWQARLFAVTVALVERGLFAWPDWTRAFAAALRAAEARATPPEDAEARAAVHWHAWSEALSALLAERGVATPAELARCAGAWQEAAARTPHGQPIRLGGSRPGGGTGGRDPSA